MRLHHKTPCKACPWRRAAVAGWLGGYPAEYYADAVIAGEVTACHNRDRGPESPDTAFCAGALATMANACALPTERWPGQAGAAAARQEVGRSPDVFTHPAEFYQHHTGEPYAHPLTRRKTP